MTVVTKSATATSSVSSVATASVNMTGMTMLCVMGVQFGTTFAATPVTDSSGNTWVNVATGAIANSQQIGFWRVFTPTVTSTMTFTIHSTGSTSGLAVAVIGWDGTSPAVDQGSSSTFGSNGTGLTITTPSITTTAATELLVTGYTNNDGGDVVSVTTAGATSTTFVKDEDIDGSSGQRITLAHALPLATGTYAAKWTTNTSAASNDGIISFSSSGGGGAVTPEYRLLMLGVL